MSGGVLGFVRIATLIMWEEADAFGETGRVDVAVGFVGGIV